MDKKYFSIPLYAYNFLDEFTKTHSFTHLLLRFGYWAVVRYIGLVGIIYNLFKYASDNM